MKKQPLMLRTGIVLVILLVFGISIWPPFQRDFYKTFQSVWKNPSDAELTALVAEAKSMTAKNPELFATQALLTAAENKGIEFKPRVNGQGLEDNRDVLNMVRKKASSSIRLGLDLNGGVEFVLKLQPDEVFLKRLEAIGKDDRKDAETRMRAEFDRYRDVAIEILRSRLEQQKIYEAEISPSGGEHVSIKAPIVAKDEKLKLMNLIAMSAKLEFRLVAANNEELVAQYRENPDHFIVPPGYEHMTETRFRPGQAPEISHFFVEIKPQMDGKGIADARADRDQFGQRQILLRFNKEGAIRFGEITTPNVGRMLAIVLDGKLYSAPRLNQAITEGSASITGSFSEEECKNVADALVSGSFPFQIKIDAVFDTDPKLGADNVSNGIWVGLLALVVVGIFMIVYYLRAGVIAVLALSVNVVLILGAMAAFDCTLTLPGIAGIVLTIGMAVDANVLVFERIREELASGKNLASSVALGFSRAYSAVLDSNLTTLIVGIILLYVGTGPIKGFAVTLSIGILTSLFTALFLSRLVFDYMDRYASFKGLKMMQVFHNPNYNFVKTWKPAIIVSSILIVLSIAAAVYRSGDALSVDFTGGTLVTYDYKQIVPADRVAALLKENKFDAIVTYKSGATADVRKIEFLLRNVPTDEQGGAVSPKSQIAEIVNKAYPEISLSSGGETTVGGLIGKEFSRTALLALLLSTIGIGIYITLRYEFSYAMATVLSMLHDVFIVMGIFLVCGGEVSLSVVAALLTAIGYSVNDTVVVFDRIRENVKLGMQGSYQDVVNRSLNQTLSRTMLTSGSTFLVVLILWLWGSVAIADFVVVMMWGVVIGTYSSLFIATPIIAHWHKRVARLDRTEKPAKTEKAIPAKTAE